jgi:3-hydroxyacyl-[acyl-carrier-protein] dehydratase
VRFLMVDRIKELESGKRALGVKNVALSEDFLTHHFPETPIMPGALIVESLVQLADWIIRESSGFERVGLPIQFERARFQRIVRPGDQLHLEVELLAAEGETARFRGEASCDGRRVASARFTLGVTAAAPFQSADESRRLFRTITFGLEPAAR